MRALPRPAVWPQLVAISLMGLAAAGCSADSARFGDWFSSTNSSASRTDTSGGAQMASTSRIETKALPHLASAEDGGAASNRGMTSYPASGSASYPPVAQPNWTREGATAITIKPGQNLDSVAREHGVPVSAIMQANNISNPAAIYPGQHLIIPRYGSPSAPPQTRTAAVNPTPSGRRGALVAPSVVHVVRAGETLNSIARTYHKPVTVVAKANSLSVAARLKAGDRITIPEIKEASREPVPARAEPATPSTGSLAMAEPQQTVRIAEPAASATTGQDNVVKSAEPAGSLPGFRWPVRGRVIGAFGPKPNGVQNDGINLAVPEGTPIKAAEDGVVAYAGNELKGYGNLVLVRHSNGFVTAYAHASDILVKRGEAVKRGQVIAHAGQTGNVTSPQLHFEIRKGPTPVDPAQYLSGA
jgi:murein DD-endopeptidase MepM/ murein hydrolase activator NlpD